MLQLTACKDPRGSVLDSDLLILFVSHKVSTLR